jgi:GT2 family glycosyltransferase
MFLEKAYDFVAKFGDTSAWHLHKPFAYELMYRLKPEVFVELGVQNGNSYFTFCQSVEEHNLSTICYGIDHWSGDEFTGNYSTRTYEEVIDHNQKFSDFSYLIKSNFNDASSQFSNNSVDLLHIDGNHSYESVSEDWLKWRDKLTHRGIVLFHDISEKKSGFGVWKLWEELIIEYPNFSFKYGSGLGVLQIDKSYEEVTINDDFILSKNAVHQINKLFLFCNQKYLTEKDPKFRDLMKNNLALKEDYKKLSSTLNEVKLYDNKKIEELNLLNRKLLELENKIDVLNKSLNYAKVGNKNITSELRISLDKNNRYKNSFSWKITSPLRFLRRHLIDRYTPQCVDVDNEKFSYQNWVNNYEKFLEEVILPKLPEINSTPYFSILLPVYDPPPELLRSCINSVIGQIFNNWELCIVDDNSTNHEIEEIIQQYASIDNRIKFKFNSVNEHISSTSNTAAKQASGEFLVFLDHDDLLSPNALHECFKYISKNENANIIYTDEDKIDLHGNRSDPYFKPDWNPLLLTSQNFLCHLFVIRKSLFFKVNGFRVGYEGSQDWDLILRATKECENRNIIHIPKILYHWRVHDHSSSLSIESKSYAIESAIKAVTDYYDGNKYFSHCSVTKKQFCRTNYNFEIINSSTSVSIIILTKNNFKILQQCIATIHKFTSGIDFEIIIINNSDESYDKSSFYRGLLVEFQNTSIFDYSHPFNFSLMNNFAAKFSSNQNLLFLNDDTEVTHNNWLHEMMVHLKEDSTGAVGPKLSYPNGNIQHCGILLGYCGVAGELYKGESHDHPGQMQRANLLQNVSAVTGACLAIRKDLFIEIGGFDGENLPIAFNDVDLCLRLLDRGYRNVFTPYAKLIHHESLSRGSDHSPQRIADFKKECNYMQNKWKNILYSDPCYNRNLSLDSNKQFSLSFPPR